MSFSLVSIEETFTASGGERVDVYRGMAGNLGADKYALINSKTGWSQVTAKTNLPTDDFNGECDVAFRYSISTDGTVRPSSDPDFGLIKRTWTRHANANQEPLANHPRVVADITSRNSAWLDVPGILYTSAEGYASAEKQYLSLVFAGNTSAVRPVKLDFFEAAVAGFYLDTQASDCAAWLFSEYCTDKNASYDFDQYVLRKSEVVTSGSVLRASDTNVGRLLTHSTLTTSEPTLPAAALLASAGLTTWYWLKKAPEIEAVSGGNFQIVQEYWGFPFVTPFMLDRYGVAL